MVGTSSIGQTETPITGLLLPRFEWPDGQTEYLVLGDNYRVGPRNELRSLPFAEQRLAPNRLSHERVGFHTWTVDRDSEWWSIGIVSRDSEERDAAFEATLMHEGQALENGLWGARAPNSERIALWRAERLQHVSLEVRGHSARSMSLERRYYHFRNLYIVIEYAWLDGQEGRPNDFFDGVQLAPENRAFRYEANNQIEYVWWRDEEYRARTGTELRRPDVLP